VQAKPGGSPSTATWTRVGAENATVTPGSASGARPSFRYSGIQQVGPGIFVRATLKAVSKAGVARQAWTQPTVSDSINHITGNFSGTWQFGGSVLSWSGGATWVRAVPGPNANGQFSMTAGSYTITVTGTGSAVHSASYTLTLNGTGGCTGAGQKLGNPGFETATTPWTATTGVIGANTGDGSPRTGTRDAWLDGYGSTHTDTLSQSVSLPTGCRSYTLSFYLKISTAETTTTSQYDKLTVQVGAATLQVFSNLNASAYTLRSYDLAAFAGQTVTLKFTGAEDASLKTSFVIDDTALTVS